MGNSWSSFRKQLMRCLTTLPALWVTRNFTRAARSCGNCPEFIGDAALGRCALLQRWLRDRLHHHHHHVGEQNHANHNEGPRHQQGGTVDRETTYLVYFLIRKEALEELKCFCERFYESKGYMPVLVLRKKSTHPQGRSRG